MANPEGRPQNLLIFHSSGLDCAFPLEAVREIVPMAMLSSPPGLPSGLAGFLDLRGTAIPIVRLDRLFDLPEQLPGLHTPMIVLRGAPRSDRHSGGIRSRHRSSAFLAALGDTRRTALSGLRNGRSRTRRRSDSSAFAGRSAGGERRSLTGRLQRHGAGSPAPHAGSETARREFELRIPGSGL